MRENSRSVTDDKILWVDCIGGLMVGVIVLALCIPLSQLEDLPLTTIVGMGIANLIYGIYSLTVTRSTPRPRLLIQVLAMANMAWLLVCISIVWTFWQRIDILGTIHVLGEGIYVAGLGYVEWRRQDELSSPKVEAR